jgi:hypothetical protein
MYVFPIFPDTEHGDPIIQSFSIGDSWCTKFDDTYFYACSSDGTQLRRFSINASGTVTQLESYATGLSSAGGDTPPKISPVLYNGNVYVGGTPATGASAFFPITGSQGQLGTRVDGAISFLNNFDYQLNGPSRSTTSKQYVPFQAGAFFIPDIFNGTNQFFWFIANITPPATATGKFVGSAVYKAIEINRIGGIIPRIWPSKKNITVMA